MGFDVAISRPASLKPVLVKSHPVGYKCDYDIQVPPDDFRNVSKAVLVVFLEVLTRVVLGIRLNRVQVLETDGLRLFLECEPVDGIRELVVDCFEDITTIRIRRSLPAVEPGNSKYRKRRRTALMGIYHQSG